MNNVNLYVQKISKMVLITLLTFGMYSLFLRGKTTGYIARHLTNEDILTPTGKTQWGSSTIKSILQNEKYKGDALLQKKFTVDFLSHKKKKNEGEVPQYYVKNSHEAIISPETFDLVQYEMGERKKQSYGGGGNLLDNKVVCEKCGSFYGSKLLHSNSKYRRTVYRCNNKYKSKDKCNTRYVYEDEVKEAFIKAFNKLIKGKQEVIEKSMNIICEYLDKSELEKDLKALQCEKEKIYEDDCKLIKAYAHKGTNQEYETKHAHYICEYEELNDKITNIKRKIKDNDVAVTKIKYMVNMIKSRDMIEEFDEELWYGVVDKVVVGEDKKFTFIFRNGMQIDM